MAGIIEVEAAGVIYEFPDTMSEKEMGDVLKREVGAQGGDMYFPVSEEQPITAEHQAANSAGASPAQAVPPQLEVTGDVAAAYGLLLKNEGARGDNTGAADTGEIGVTESARKAVRKQYGAQADSFDDKQYAKSYLNILDTKMREIAPATTPSVVRQVMLDSAYNLGEGVFKYKGVRRALNEHDWVGVGESLLDTATVNGQAVRGLAKRRAQQYNKIADRFGGEIITQVNQEEDGTIQYLAEGGGIVFEYKPEGGRHRRSAVGMLRV